MKKYNKKSSLFRDKKTVILMCIALVYLFIVLDITLIDRSVGQRRKMLEPFWEISQFLETKQYTYWIIQIFGKFPFVFYIFHIQRQNLNYVFADICDNWVKLSTKMFIKKLYITYSQIKIIFYYIFIHCYSSKYLC